LTGNANPENTRNTKVSKSPGPETETAVPLDLDLAMDEDC